MEYTTKEASIIFHVEPQSVIRWADKFYKYLDPKACPGSRKTRYYSDKDMRKLELIRQMSAVHTPEEEISAALEIGQDRDIPDDVTALAYVGKPTPKHLQARVEFLTQQIKQLENEKMRLEAKNEQQREVIDEKDRQILELNKRIWLLESGMVKSE